MARVKSAAGSHATFSRAGAVVCAILLAATGWLLLGGNGWQAGPVAAAGRCPLQLCPPCDSGSSSQAAAAAEVAAGGLMGQQQDCPPPPECPQPEPQQCQECPPQLECPQQPECPPAEQCPDCPACAAEVASAGKQQQQQQQPTAKGKQQAAKGKQPAPGKATQGKQPAEQQGGGAAAAAGEQQEQQEDEGELLCGGPGNIPLVADALEDARGALEQAVLDGFAPWDQAGFTLEDLMETADNLQADGTHDTLVWVEVRNGTVVFPRRDGMICEWFCNPSLFPIRDAFNEALRTKRLHVPEGMPMLWNAYDYSVCTVDESGSSACKAPVLSIIKFWHDRDTLVPPFFPRFEPQFVPWDEKKSLAFFRGTGFCNAHPLNATTMDYANCSRAALPLLTPKYPELLNITVKNHVDGTPGTPGPDATHHEHAYYKYLANLDGYTASRRMATLLSMNSLVLKQQSPQLEWYYGAIKPCVHYLPFWQRSEHDILDLVRRLNAGPGNQAVAQRVAANGQAFAAAFLTEDASLAYWQRVIDRYAELYRGSDSEATAAARAAAEALGQKASRVGKAAEDKCWEERTGECWRMGRDAAFAERDRLKAEAAAGGAAAAATKGDRAAAAAAAAAEEGTAVAEPAGEDDEHPPRLPAEDRAAAGADDSAENSSSDVDGATAEAGGAAAAEDSTADAEAA